jgi:hypothetical protein
MTRGLNPTAFTDKLFKHQILSSNYPSTLSLTLNCTTPFFSAIKNPSAYTSYPLLPDPTSRPRLNPHLKLPKHPPQRKHKLHMRQRPSATPLRPNTKWAKRALRQLHAPAPNPFRGVLNPSLRPICCRGRLVFRIPHQAIGRRPDLDAARDGLAVDGGAAGEDFAGKHAGRGRREAHCFVDAGAGAGAGGQRRGRARCLICGGKRWEVRGWLLAARWGSWRGRRGVAARAGEDVAEPVGGC